MVSAIVFVNAKFSHLTNMSDTEFIKVFAADSVKFCFEFRIMIQKEK